jgi:spermidine/putrescine transport system permease protein
MLLNFNWPVATALSTIMLVLMFVSIVLIYVVLGRFGGDISDAA